MQRWVLAAFAVFGAFIACSFGGAVVASLVGLWDLPVAGFFAAFAVVAVTYLAAPARGRELAGVVFLAGCAAAWWLLEPSFYPESYASRAYQPTHLPFLASLAGGAVALAVCVFPFRGSLRG